MMSRRKARPSDSGRYELVPCKPDDKDFARRVHHAAYRDVVTRQFGEWDAEKQGGFFDAKWVPSRYQLIVVGGTAMGVLMYRVEPDHIELEEIQLLPDAQGQGLGSAIIRDLQDLAARSATSLRLRVLKLNRARELYDRLGLAVTGETEHHYQMEWWPGDTARRG